MKSWKRQKKAPGTTATSDKCFSTVEEKLASNCDDIVMFRQITLGLGSNKYDQGIICSGCFVISVHFWLRTLSRL